jgi:hypothetical protein
MKRTLIVLISILFCSAIQAQDKTVDEVQSKVSDPLLRSGGRTTDPGVSFQFSKDDKNATAQIGGELGTAGSSWGLTVGGPLSKSSDTTTLATSEGLNSGFNAEFLLRKLALRRFSTAKIIQLCKEKHPSKQDCALKDFDADTLNETAFQTALMYGVSVKVGRKTFDFTTPTSFLDQSETHDGSSFAGTIGALLPGSLFYYLGGSFRHETAFVGGGIENICTPIGGSTSTFCRDIAVGAPERRTTNLLQLEMRNFIGENIALAPRVTYETDKRTWSIEAPIYLRQGDGPFNGGVNLGWDSKQHQVLVSLFVGMLPKLPQ